MDGFVDQMGADENTEEEEEEDKTGEK